MTEKSKKNQTVTMPDGFKLRLGTIHDSGEYETIILEHSVPEKDLEAEDNVVTEETVPIKIKLFMWACFLSIMNLVATAVFMAFGENIWSTISAFATGGTVVMLGIIASDIVRRKK